MPWQGALQALVFNGVDIEAENASGATVLQLARAFGREACEEFLMERVSEHAYLAVGCIFVRSDY